MRVLKHVLALTVLAAAPLAAQRQRPLQTFGPAEWTMVPQYRTVQRAALDAQKKLLLAMADSMPENQYRDKVTAPQRDFAQQLHHVVSSNVFIASYYIAGAGDPQPPASDTAAIWNSRAGLKAYINASYDYLGGLLDRTSDADRNIVVGFFGGQRMPRWQVWDELNQHAMWTLGQTVANFRKQGMAPPSFLFF